MWKEHKNNIEQFSERLLSALEEIGISQVCAGLTMDHVCIRIAESADVDLLRRELLADADEISCENINGRDIMIFQLRVPLNVGGWKVYGIELPYPKPDNKYTDGWEHIELVLPQTEATMDAVRESFFQICDISRDALGEKYKYKESEPTAEGEQLPNPTIGLKVSGIGIKFHPSTVQEVVGYKV